MTDVPSTPEVPELEWAPGPLVRLVVDATLLLVGVGYLVLAFQLPFTTESGPGAGFYPVGAGTLFVVCIAIETARAVTGLRPGGDVEPRGRFRAAVPIVLGTIAAYILLAQILGHLVVAVLLVGILLRSLGARPWWQVALTAVLAAVGSDLLFGALLGLDLPSGLLQIGVSQWI